MTKSTQTFERRRLSQMGALDLGWDWASGSVTPKCLPQEMCLWEHNGGVVLKQSQCSYNGNSMSIHGGGGWILASKKMHILGGGKYCKNVQNMREERASKITEMQKLPKKDMRKRHQIGEGFRFYSPATVPSQLLPACCCRHPPKKGEMQKCSKFFGVNQKKCTEKPP